MREDIKKCVKSRTCEIYARAQSKSDEIAEKSAAFINDYVISKKDGLCFAATGSVGRGEALEASDLDLVPIAMDR